MQGGVLTMYTTRRSDIRVGRSKLADSNAGTILGKDISYLVMHFQSKFQVGMGVSSDKVSKTEVDRGTLSRKEIRARVACK